MRVILAGYNTDIENAAATPETISAAYARISRDPAPVPELRRKAADEVEEARRSNRTIVYKYGHGSIAEHAVFNLDVLGISRLAVEALQSFRLASFTEKSQRYIRIGTDWFLPPELEDRVSLLEKLFGAYSRLVDLIEKAGFPPGSAREDARYILPLAATSQMGITVNARELELMVRRMAAHPLEEVRRLSSMLLDAVMPVAPSLMLFTEPGEMDRIAHIQPVPIPNGGSSPVRLQRCDDDSVVEGWLSSVFGAPDFERVYAGLGVHDTLPRFWELFRADFLVDTSAAAYAQLKRHRMSTQLPSVYHHSLGVTVPPSVKQAGAEELFTEMTAVAAEAAGTGCRQGEYLLTNAHRRQVRVCMNGRELNHFSRLREDDHAQWDIRGIASEMVSLVREKAPRTTALTCGKSHWTSISGKPAP